MGGEGFADRRRVSIPAWVLNAVTLVIGIILATVGTLTWMSSTYVPRAEWHVLEVREQEDVRRTAADLATHIEQTRLDAVRLGTIEAQLGAIREDLKWFKDRLEHKEGKP